MARYPDRHQHRRGYRHRRDRYNLAERPDQHLTGTQNLPCSKALPGVLQSLDLVAPDLAESMLD
jgi:hypothetical protein